MAQYDPELVALVVFFASGVAGGAVLFAMQHEVNRTLPKGQRIPYFELRRSGGFVKLMRILRVHRELYPGNLLPVLYWLLMALSIIAFLFAVLSSASRRTT